MSEVGSRALQPIAKTVTRIYAPQVLLAAHKFCTLGGSVRDRGGAPIKGKVK